MIKKERYDQILAILEKEKYISANELAKRLYVSLPTIRRDLAALEAKKQILRSHGGASKISSAHTCLPLDFRKGVHHTEKRALCRAAAQLVREKDIIFIDASTSAQPIAEFLDAKWGITVVTNSIQLAFLLKEKGILSYTTGGEIKEDAMCFIGCFAEEFVQKFNFDLMFFSCKGVNDEGMIVDVSLPENSLRRCALRRSKKSVFLCDSSKFNLSAPYNLAPADRIDHIITNADDVHSLLPSVKKEHIHIVR